MKDKLGPPRTKGSWVHDDESIIDNEGYILGSMDSERENAGTDYSNAAFVVQACNAHDKLVKALTDLLAHEGEQEFSGIGSACDSDALEAAKISAREALELAGRE